MARLFGDGFDHYGNTETFMLDGVYADASNCTLTSSSPTPATGSHCIGMTGFDNASFTSGLRKVLPTAIDKIGMTARFYFPSLPSDNGSVIFDCLSSSPQRGQVSVQCDANGRLTFYRGAYMGFTDPTNGTLIAQTDPVLTAAAWHHVEIQIYIHDTDGWVRVAVNGVHEYEATGLDTKYDSTNIVSVCQHNRNIGARTTWYMDDYIVYDFTGDSSVDTDFCPTTDGSGKAIGYIGELQGIWLPPNGNTAENDWVPSTGVDASAMVDETDPNDADYITSTAAGDLSEFSLTDLPVDITYIRGVDVWGRMSKIDSGAAMVKFGMKSVAATEDADERPVTVAPTYWWDQINQDPNSGARWTRASLNAAWYRLTRSV